MHRRGADCGTVGACATGPLPGTIPDAPGSYQFLDRDGRVLYVGKAKSLRSRLSNYFADPATLPARTAQMVAAADRVEWIQVANEVEAILLEYALIKRHRPRFNIRLVDDKSYPWLAVTLADEWPRAAVVRGRRRPERPLLRSLRPRGGASATPSICCCAPSRCARAPTPSSNVTSSWAGPA